MRSSYLPLLLSAAFLMFCGQLQAAQLLTSYLPASMQALAYYIDLLQYEPLSSTTVEPPFSAEVEGAATSSTPATFTTTAKPWSKPQPTKPASSTTNRPNGSSSSWWQPPKPQPTKGPTSTTNRPSGSSSSWWQPPSWWEQPQRTTTVKPTAAPTLTHRPALFAPAKPPRAKLEGYGLFNEITDDSDFDRLPLSLIQDIQTEVDHDDFTNDVESLDNFLRIYDDNYGRAVFDFESAMDRWSTTSTAGKKRVPPTKPYVDFLLVYDLLKRDAKAANLSKYEGYTEEMLQDLYELSQASATRQLYTLLQRMLDRGDIQRSDVVSRVQSIVKDLANPQSPTSKALLYIPTMQFLP